MIKDGAPWTVSGSTPSFHYGKQKFRKMYWAAIAALSFAVAMGMACGYSASATADMRKKSSPVHPSEDQITWIGSLIALGALIGGIIAGYLSNRFGRKGTLLLIAVPFLGGWLFLTYANHIAYIYVGRLLTGICVGIICVTTPSYLVEISTPEVRGLLGGSFQLFVVIGVLLVNGLGAILTWQWLSIPSEAFLIVALIAICAVPESPRWLIAKGNYQKAVASVKFLQGDYLDASAECIAIDEDLRLQPKGAVSFQELAKKMCFIPALISFCLMFFQQACGSNAILFYTVNIFQSSGSALDPNIATIIIDVVLVIATAASSSLLDKAGRKLLLLVSGSGMTLSLAALGCYDYLSKHAWVKETYSWVPLVSLIIYITAFSLGFGPIPWLITAEITPVRVRSVISGVATTLCWLFVFIVTKTFKSLSISIHYYGAYWLYACFSALSCIFVFFFVPETKGKALEDIQLYFSNYRIRGKIQMLDEEFI